MRYFFILSIAITLVHHVQSLDEVECVLSASANFGDPVSSQVETLTSVNNFAVLRDELDLLSLIGSETIVKNHLAGIYRGQEASTDIINFFTNNGIFESQTVQSQLSFVNVTNSSLCSFRLLSTAIRSTNGTVSGVTNDTVASVTNLYWDPESEYMKEIDIYYNNAYIEHAMNATCNNEQAVEFICNTIVNHCTLESITDVSECRSELGSLPITNNNGYIDGNSVGCRMLHASMALKRPERYCPNISFTAQTNSSFCQSSSLLEPLDIVNQAALDDFRYYIKATTINETTGFRVNEEEKASATVETSSSFAVLGYRSIIVIVCIQLYFVYCCL